MMKTIAVIGLGQFGFQVAISLAQKGFDVIAIDNEPDTIAEIKDMVGQAFILDSTDEKAMRSVHIDRVDDAVIAIGSNVQSSLLSAALCQQMGISDIYVRAISPLQENILRSMGIPHLLNIERNMGIQIANTISSNVGNHIEISDCHSLIETQVPTPIVGKKLSELHLRSRYKINIIGIKTRQPIVTDNGDIAFKSNMSDIPDPEYVFNDSDVILIVGLDDHLKKFIRLGDSRS